MTDPAWTGPVRDEPFAVTPRRSEPDFRGAIWSVRTDQIVLGRQTVKRDLVIHPGAVGIVVLDVHDRVYLLRQYRHPVGMMLFEPPAGVIDRIHDDPLETARRELREEAGLEAADWRVLVDYFTTPGSSSEGIRIYLARDITPAPGGRVITGEAEEASLPGVWVPLSDAVGLVLAGRLGNPTAVLGILAAVAAQARGWSDLRPPNAPWPARQHLIDTDRVFAIKPE